MWNEASETTTPQDGSQAKHGCCNRSEDCGEADKLSRTGKPPQAWTGRVRSIYKWADPNSPSREVRLVWMLVVDKLAVIPLEPPNHSRIQATDFPRGVLACCFVVVAQQGGGVQKETPLPTVHSHVAVYRERHHIPRPMVFIKARGGPRGTMAWELRLH